MSQEKIYLKSYGYDNEDSYVIKGTNCVYLFQRSASGQWNNTTLTEELLIELLSIAK